MRKRFGAGLVLVGLLVGMLPLVAAADGHNRNHPDWWEQNGNFPHDAVCFNGDSSHGDVVNYQGEQDTAVRLNALNPSWPGDHWEALIVKGGSATYGEGAGRVVNGNIVYIHPEAGVKYPAPLNDGDQQAGVSHWIVCKGTTPEQPTTTTTTEAPTTTTTVPEETTTTEPPTTTTEPPVDTTEPPVVTTQPPTSTPEELPFTGIEDTGLYLALAAALMLAGLTLVVAGRKEEDI